MLPFFSEVSCGVRSWERNSSEMSFQPGWATPIYGSMGIALIKAV